MVRLTPRQREGLELVLKHGSVSIDWPCAYWLGRKIAEALERKGLITISWSFGRGTAKPTDLATQGAPDVRVL